MTSVTGLPASGDAHLPVTASSSVSALQSQIDNLQRQCADWKGCATTPATEKQKIVSALTEQIAGLQAKIEHAQQLPSTQLPSTQQSSAHIAAPVSEIESVNRLPRPVNVIPPADGINRPDQNPFAVAGSVVKTSV